MDPDKAIILRLTDRERETLIGIAKGLTSKEIGKQLGVSFKTVEAHRAALKLKAGDGNIASLTRLAIRSGLIQA